VHQDSSVTVKAFLVKHATWDQAFGYRFEAAGRSVVISGDTAPTPSVAEACNGCDVLVHEVYCNPPAQGGSAYYKAAHTSAAELAEIATQAKPNCWFSIINFSADVPRRVIAASATKYAGAVVSAKDLDITDERRGLLCGAGC